MGRTPGRATLLGIALATALPACALGAPGRTSLEGEWEMYVASPRRPWLFSVRFVPEGSRWTGTLRLHGFGEFTLRDVSTSTDSVRFLFPPELDSIPFDGVFGDSVIEGRLVENGAPVAARLTRVVPLPPAGTRDEAWRQDLDCASARLSTYDRSFSPAAREEFRRVLERLKLEIARKRDDEILVELSRAVALADNAHTRLRLEPTKDGAFSTEFPLRIWWFDDGPFVVKAAPELQRALRCRWVAVEGRPISEARKAVEPLFAGNEAWRDYFAPIYLLNPDVLHGLGLIATRDRATFTFEDDRGGRFDLTLPARPRDPKAPRTESWQLLSPTTKQGSPPWSSALEDDAGPLPICLRRLDRAYHFEYLADRRMLYFQFNRSGDALDGPSFREFSDSLLAFAHQHEVEDFVVDLRFNTGGNLDVAKPFMKRLADEERLNRPGHIFVIVGECTFSAGLYHAAQLKQYTRATFVGEPVGDRLDFWAEGGRIVLPHSRASIQYSNGFHRYSTADSPEHRPYYEELSIPTLEPDVRAPLRASDYFSRRDPALEAIFARTARAE